MDAGYNVNADILKVGHHGSRTSSGASFINAERSPFWIKMNLSSGCKLLKTVSTRISLHFPQILELLISGFAGYVGEPKQP
jgi:hypothetical protein